MTIPDAWQGEFLATLDVPGHGLCGVQRFVYTCGLLTNLTFDGLTYGYNARYCYERAYEAIRSLSTWDGMGDPPGEWIKEKVSDRDGPGARL